MGNRNITISLLPTTYAELEDIVNTYNQIVDKQDTCEDFAKQAVICELERYTNFGNIAKEEQVMPTIAHPESKIKLTLREYFFQKRISQTDICEELGISNGTMSGIVNGKHKPNFEVFLKIYFHLGCPPLHEIICVEQ